MPITDIVAVAAERGHHLRGLFTSLEYDLDLHYGLDAELDGSFEATDADTGELLLVNGWLFSPVECD